MALRAYRYVRNAMTPRPFGRNRAPHAHAVAAAIGYALVRIDSLRNRPGRYRRVTSNKIDWNPAHSVLGPMSQYTLTVLHGTVRSSALKPSPLFLKLLLK